MAAPELYDIDLLAIPNLTPDLIDVNLLGEPAVGNVAVLSFSASGVGGTAVSGAGSASLGLVATGIGYRVNAGSGAPVLAFSANGSGAPGFRGTGTAQLSVVGAGRGFQDWLSQLPPIQLQEVYRLVITGSADGLDDLYVGGISSWQATNQAGDRNSYVQAVIPAAADLIDDVEARSQGDLVIQKGYRFNDGQVRYDEILRSRFDTLRFDQGSRNLTLTVSGYQSQKPLSLGTRTLSGARSVSNADGKSRVRCEIDMFLQPGMTVIVGEQSFVADYINYYVSDVDKFCEVGQR